jgi:hypothetical protein
MQTQAATQAQPATNQTQIRDGQQQQQTQGQAAPTNRSIASELGFDDAATMQTFMSTMIKKTEQL